MSTPPSDDRRFGALSRRGPNARPITTQEARSRTSAYVYGNILVLAAVIGVDEHAIDGGQAVVVVLATTLTTYVAHVLAHDIAESIGRTEVEHRQEVLQELRDAFSIISSGVVPAVVLAAAAVGWLPTRAAQLTAAAIIVLRLAATGLTVERLSGRRASAGAFWTGVGLAGVSALLAVAKVAFTH